MTRNSSTVKPARHAVAVVLYDDQGRFLAVRRSDDDESLPGVWGLPAASLRAGESDEDAVVRAGREKLGVELRVLDRVGTEKAEREQFTLTLSDYRVVLEKGVPAVPQPFDDVSQYVDMTYTKDLGLLVEAARRGSLCSRVLLNSEGYDWH
ncbi:NUDIX domain-containing protein [Micromonospora sp. CA-244673]|uniref:NUDIX domain-containing protein n=1 Tax=Micromonospora sp. CA-244673 TaxID=3239958 RepID=UPI003D9360B7